MTPPRDQVVCRQCGAVLGRFADGKTSGGRQTPNQYRFVPRFHLNHDVMIFLVAGRAEISCPECGQIRQIDLHRYSLVLCGNAA